MVMLESKAVRDVSDEDLSEDPLLFLSCGHAFPMSNLDGHLELGKHYTRTPSGVWSAALEPKVKTQHGFGKRESTLTTHCRWQEHLPDGGTVRMLCTSSCLSCFVEAMKVTANLIEFGSCLLAGGQAGWHAKASQVKISW